MRLRTIRESPQFTAAAAKLEPNCERWDDIMSGVVWTLARDPFDDEATSAVSRVDPNLRMIFTAAFPPNIPGYRILYRVEDDETVTLLYVDLDPDAEESDIIG